MPRLILFLMAGFFHFSAFADELPSDNTPGGGKKGGIFKMHYNRYGMRWPVRKGSWWTSVSTNRWLYPFPKSTAGDGFPLQFSVDYSFEDHWTIGAYGAYYRSILTASYGTSQIQYPITGYSAGSRLGFHFTDLFNDSFGEVVNMSKWDFYSTAHIGFISYRFDGSAEVRTQDQYRNATLPSLGIVLGSRYLITPHFAVFAEAGKGTLGYFGAGAAFKLR